MFPKLFAVNYMSKSDYFNYGGRERRYEYESFEMQHDVTGKGLGFGVDIYHYEKSKIKIT